MNYCRRCILPDSRPGITLDNEGVCSACRGQDDKESLIDWEARRLQLESIVEEAKGRATSYDCIVPVSGGKDSWYQVIKCQELGMRPLAITWRTPGRTEIGQSNLDNMIARLGVDHIDYTINPDVERRFMKAAYERKGATAIPMHMAIFAIPIRLATQFRIPLIVWGENPQLEFGGGKDERLATDLDLDWLRKHGVTNETQIEDWIGAEGLTAQEFAAYQLPEEKDFSFSSRSIFLGSFLEWNSFENTRVSEERGFKSSDQSRTGTWNFADIDCRFIALHHFMKWYKFGITRAFDNLSVQIRYDMITRDKAISALKQTGLQVPSEDIKAFCDFIGQPVSWFWDVAETFRNKKIWCQVDGEWQIPGFLISDWEWRICP